jgi:16S rRNA (cytidine1402-2'-O)-methyltransferase
MAGSLVLLATPIGNLGDITLRALERIKTLDGLICEDTRRTRVLLQAHGLRVPLLSLPAFAERSRTAALVERIEKGSTLGFATDAGSAGISDPGQFLVRSALSRGIHVEALPGASAAVTALQLSGFACERFAFFGFLPRKGTARKAAIADLSEALRLRLAVVLYESPRRLEATLADLHDVLGERRAVVARELTKLHEEVAHGTLGELATRFSGDIRGEVTLVIDAETAQPEQTTEHGDLEKEIAILLDQGLGTRQVARRIAASSGLSAREAYRRVLTRGPRP